VPTPLRRGAIDQIEGRLPARLRRARVALRALRGDDEAERLEGWFAPFTSREREALLAAVDRRAGVDIALGQGDPVRRMLYADCHAWLADNLLERGDRMSMAASLELRPPFLDHQMVELAFSLPSNVKVRHGVTKWVVKEVARSVLPSEIVDRPKAGFRVPIATWLRGSMRDMAYDRLLSGNSFVSDVFDRGVVQEFLDAHGSGARNEDIRIWTLLCLEVWHDQFRGQLAGASSSSEVSSTVRSG
jgi:asparagine synthase (glutamine-hydrolysing)